MNATIWENVQSGTERCVNTGRSLTRSLDIGEEGLAMQATRLCSVTDCGRPARARGWCATHWKRWRTTGEPGTAELIKKPRGSKCEVPDCDKPQHGRGYCATHYQRVRKYGDPNVDLKRRGDEITYSRAHGRLRERLGPACEYPCGHCDSQAVDWAYDHADTAERRNEEGHPYSADPAHYLSLCRPCHTRYDRNYEAVA